MGPFFAPSLILECLPSVYKAQPSVISTKGLYFVSNVCQLESLPTELILDIFQHLDYRALLVCKKVSLTDTLMNSQPVPN